GDPAAREHGDPPRRPALRPRPRREGPGGRRRVRALAAADLSRARVVETRARPLLFAPRLFAVAAGPAAATAASAAAAAVAVAARPILARLARRCVLRPLHELLGRDELPVFVLLHELEADPAARLVDLL